MTGFAFAPSVPRTSQAPSTLAVRLPPLLLPAREAIRALDQRDRPAGRRGAGRLQRVVGHLIGESFFVILFHVNCRSANGSALSADIISKSLALTSLSQAGSRSAAPEIFL